MMRRRLSIVLIILALSWVTVAWLLFTESGLHAAAAMATRLSGDRLQMEQVTGYLSNQVQIGNLRWQDETTTLEAKGISFRWSPLALLRGTAEIDALGIAQLDIVTRDSKEAAHLPDSLALPVDVRLAALALGTLRINAQLIADKTTAALHGRDGAYVLEALELRRADMTLLAQGELSTHKPYALTLNAALAGKIVDQAFALAVQAGGDLQRTELSLQRKEGPFGLEANAVLNPFADQMLAAFSIKAERLDLAALVPEFPHTRIDAVCHLQENKTVSPADRPGANCRLDNALAGPIDQARLPLAQFAARLEARADVLHLSGLRITSGSGALQGNANWSAAGLNANLAAQALNLAEIHSRAQRSKLTGPVTLVQNAAGRQLRLDLREDKLAIQAQLSQHESRLDLQGLSLSAQDARLTMQGRMDTASGDFSLEGKFDRFNPAQFMRGPTGNLNGDFKLGGLVGQTPRLEASFALRDSHLANAPASGRGQLDLAWPHVRKADLQLELGPNRAQLLGAFGRAGEKLSLHIDAPALTPYGLEGDLQAHLEAGGRLDAPLLNGRMRSTSLRLPGQGRIQKLSFDANMGSTADARLNLRLLFDRLDLAARASAVRKFDLDIQGSRRQHQLSLTAQLADDLPLLMTARGGFADKDVRDWRGRLTQLTLDQASSQRFLHLDGEAALVFAPDRWAIGPALLQSPNAAIKLNASAVAGKLQLALAADNARIGHVGIDLTATPAQAWGISAQMPWQGRVQGAISDLAWLNDLLGSTWQASGSLNADVKIAGTPQFPLLNGQISGNKLGLRHLDTRMNLQNGTLLARMHDSILSLDTFDIQSELTSPPPTLQRMLDERGRSLVATPGRISARGQMKMGAFSSADAEQLRLDITLDRLGVSQTPRQWLLLSGQGQLNWQQSKLGIQAKLGVDAAHWQLADLSRPQLSDDVIVRREGNASSEVRRVTPWTGNVQVSLGRHFSFEGAGARGRLVGQVQVATSAQDLPRANGTVNLVNGRYEAYGQQLDIERGILNFQGLLENPALNILALRKGLAVEAGVEITGFAQAPRIRLVSEPNVPDAEKLSWLVLGRAPTQEGSDAGVLMAAVGAIFGNQSGAASQQIKDSFGIDEISVRSGTPGQMQAMNSRVVSMSSSSANSGQVLAVGKQLSSRLRLSYEQALGGVDSLIKLTFKLTDQISVVGTSGTDAAVDVFYTFTLGGALPGARQTTFDSR